MSVGSGGVANFVYTTNAVAKGVAAVINAGRSVVTDLFDVYWELFSSGEQGLWYDLNDDPTIFQDSAGTTLATWGDPVGRVNDKSGNGNNSIQGTGGFRPIRGRMPKRGRVNELVSTATMATQNVTVTAAQRTLSFTGTGTVTLSGASTAGPLVGTGVNDRVSLTFTPSAGTLTLTVTGSVTLAQLQLGAAFDNYQAVNDSLGFNITESGQPSCGYLSFNGSNQWMQTAAAVNFTATDEMSVFLGSFKVLSGVNNIPVELSTGAGGSVGAFGLVLPSDLTANSFNYISRGTALSTNSLANSLPGAVNSVVTGLSKISTDVNTTRKNGVLVQTVSTDQGSGNYGNHTIYFGARAGTSLFFNGLMFSIIIRGALTSGEPLTGAEKYVASCTPTVTL